MSNFRQQMAGYAAALRDPAGLGYTVLSFLFEDIILIGRTTDTVLIKESPGSQRALAALQDSVPRGRVHRRVYATTRTRAVAFRI